MPRFGLLARILGFGKKETKDAEPSNQKPIRQHPYEEITDDQLEKPREKIPRLHPYDEVTEKDLETNRNKTDRACSNEKAKKDFRKKQPQNQRTHPYDQVTDESLKANQSTHFVPGGPNVDDATVQQTASKHKTVRNEGTRLKATDTELMYVDLDIQPGGKIATSGAQSESTTYATVCHVIPDKKMIISS